MNSIHEESLRDRLNHMEWPSLFPFKFIVPIQKLDELLANFLKQDTKVKLSSKGRYASVSVSSYLLNPDKVLDVYHRVEKIEGLIAL